MLLDGTNPNGNSIPDFNISKADSENAQIKIGNKIYSLEDYLNSNPPIVWFADGSSLQGNEFVEIKSVIRPYPVEALISWNWVGVDLSKEAQGVNPIQIDSIQYKTLQILKQQDFDIIYDDDYSGEIADIITIKETTDSINVQFYHLKFAKDGLVSSRVDNFYEVCGQAQKSIHWKHKSGSEFFNTYYAEKRKRKMVFKKSY